MSNHTLSKNIYFEKIRSVVQQLMTCLTDNTVLHDAKGEDCAITDFKFLHPSPYTQTLGGQSPATVRSSI